MAYMEPHFKENFCPIKLNKYKPIIYSSFIWLLIMILINNFIPNLSQDHLSIVHFAIEIFYAFIAFACFTTFWAAERYHSTNNTLANFFLLLLTIFLVFHSYYAIKLNSNYLSFDKSRDFLILSQLVQQLLIISITFKIPKLRISRYLLLAVTIATAALTIFLIGRNIVSFNQLHNNFINFLNLILSLFCLTHLIIKERANFLLHYYIVSAVIFNIFSVILFIIDNKFFNNTISRFLECLCMFYIFKAIFQHYIIQPYENLRKQKNRIISITNHLPLGLITYDNANKELIFCNTEAKKTLAALEKSLNNNFSLAQQTVRVFDQENKPVNLKLSVYPIEDKQSLILSCDTKQEELLASLQLQTATILNSLTTPVLILNQDTILISYNKAFIDLIGYTEKEIANITVKQLKRLLKFKKNSKKKNNMYEYAIITAAGEKREITLRFSPFYDPSQRFNGNIIFALDVTENKEEQEKLSQQEKLAALGKMAAGIVHEIKNPLTTMKGFCQMITLNSRNEKVLKYAGIIESEIGDLNRVISEFLSFAKPKTPVLERINLNQLLKSMELLMEGNCFMKNIELKFIFHEFSQNISADEAQLKQVLLNIMENAIDAVCIREEPLIVIETGLTNKDKECYVSITDNGEGMSEERRQNIGTPFFTTKDKGTGLGLSICFQIIKEHKGKIKIKSELNKGTTFTLIFPVEED